MIISLNKILNINKNLIITLLLNFMIGICMLYSVAGGSITPWANKQIFYFIIFIPIASIVALLNINIYYKLSYYIYAGSLLLLIYVEILGHTAMGATRWIRIFGFTLQPSELMKIGLVMALSKYFMGKNIKQIKQNKYLIIPILLILIPVALVLKQPDLGTAGILLVIGIGMLFIAGVQWWKFAICGILFLSSLPFVWKYGLHDYQKKRVEVFLHPEEDPLESGYNITQSKIAIGSGGLYGKGYLKGTQGQLSFLPEKQTDFIFTIFAEEIGFFGIISLIIMYIIMLSTIFWISFKSKYTYGKLFASGLGLIVFLHIFINIGMVTGLLPVVGVPLPLISYGGTMTVVTLISFSFILNVDIYKEEEIKD